jgi:hypothetical protein
MGAIGCPETPVNNNHSTLRDIPEERRSRLRRGGNLKFRLINFVINIQVIHHREDRVFDSKDQLVYVV